MKNKQFLKKFSPYGLFAIGLIVGLVVMYLYFQPKLTYQGKTPQQWVDLANQNQKWANEWKQMYFTASEKLNAVQNIPTPTPAALDAAPSIDLPPSCDTTINAYMTHGYSRSMVNQFMKRDRPECSY